MELLPLEKVTGKGEREVRMIQIVRDDNKALYQRFIGGSPVGYEMFKIRRQEASTQERGGVTFEVIAKELFPNDEGFGKYAWALHTPISLDDAKKRFNALDVVTEKKRGRKPKSVIYGQADVDEDDDIEEETEETEGDEE